MLGPPQLSRGPAGRRPRRLTLDNGLLRTTLHDHEKRSRRRNRWAMKAEPAPAADSSPPSAGRPAAAAARSARARPARRCRAPAPAAPGRGTAASPPCGRGVRVTLYAAARKAGGAQCGLSSRMREARTSRVRARWTSRSADTARASKSSLVRDQRVCSASNCCQWAEPSPSLVLLTASTRTPADGPPPGVPARRPTVDGSEREASYLIGENSMLTDNGALSPHRTWPATVRRSPYRVCSDTGCYYSRRAGRRTRGGSAKNAGFCRDDPVTGFDTTWSS